MNLLLIAGAAVGAASAAILALSRERTVAPPAKPKDAFSDPNAPVVNPRLLAAMELHLAAGQGRESYLVFLKELAASALVAEIPELPPDQIAPARSGEGPQTVALVTQRTTDGRKILCVYTDDQAFARLRPSAKASIVLRARDVFDLALQIGIAEVVVNHATPSAAAVDRALFEDLALGRVPPL